MAMSTSVTFKAVISGSNESMSINNIHNIHTHTQVKQ